MKFIKVTLNNIRLCKNYTKMTRAWGVGRGVWGMGHGGDPSYSLIFGSAMFGMFVGIMYGVAR